MMGVKGVKTKQGVYNFLYTVLFSKVNGVLI